VNPYQAVIADLQLNQHSQGEWAFVWLYLDTMRQLWDSEEREPTVANPYRQAVNDLPVEGYASARIRQLLNPGLLAADARGVAH